MLRLVELRAELDAERVRSEALAAALDESRALYNEILQNRAYRTASKVWLIRGVLGA
jgi:hypothetical protein